MVSLKLDDTLISKVTAKPAILETAKGTPEILRCRAMTIEIGVPGLELSRDRQRPVAVLGPHR